MLSRKKNYMLTSIITSAILFPCIVLANSDTILVDDVNVTSSKKASTIGVTTINSSYIKSAPSATNTITDLLRGKSYIQFDQTSRSSTTGGEITPPKVSIRGSKHYENSFLLDGVNNNNNLDPKGFSASNFNGEPSGESQTLFIDTSLVDSVAIYTENIPAQFGGFTGGVIDATLKDAKTDRWRAMMNFRYTKDDWTKFHWTDKEEADLNTTTTAKLQPNFTKSEFNIALNGPLSDNLGLMVSYGRKESKIPLWSNYFIKSNSGIADTRIKRNQYRKNENFLFKFNTVGYNDFKVSLTGIYAPYKHEAQAPNYKNSEYSLKGGGYSLIYNMENSLYFGLLKNTLNFQKNEISRISNSNIANYWVHRPNGYANWKMIFGNNAGEGAYGHYKKNKTSIGYKGSIDIDKFQTGSIEHSIKTGVEVEYTLANSKTSGSTVFNRPILDTTSVGNKYNGIVTGEQYARGKVTGLQQKRDKSLVAGAIFIEDKIEFDRFKIIPGLRLSTDSITNNFDIAWRLFANVDVFNNDFLNVYGGYNRYYGSQILSHALSLPPQTQTYSRTNWSAPWTLTRATDNAFNSLGDLKTPYSDELSIGASMDILDTLFEIDLVKRDSKNELRSKLLRNSSNKTYKTFTNSGESDYWGLTLAISKNYDLGVAGNHFSKFSATKSSTKSNSFDPSISYDETNLLANRSPDYIEYNGAVTAIENIPATNMNSPWVIAYTHEANINKHIRLYGVAKYSIGGKGIKQLSGNGTVAPDGLLTRKFETKNYKDSFNIDLSAELDFKIKRNRLIFGIDILNIMNRKNESVVATGNAVTSSGSYSMGRQFFANFKYEF